MPPKQPFWDRPGILADQARVKSSSSTPVGLASLPAALSPHSRDWLFAMPISSCGLGLDDEAVRIGVCLQLGLTFCVPHWCHCGASVSAFALHGFVCKRAVREPQKDQPGISPSMTWLHEPWPPEAFLLQRNGSLSRSDGKRPDGFLLSLGRQRSHSLGTSPLCARWPIRTLPQQPEKQAQWQSWQPLGSPLRILTCWTLATLCSQLL